MQPTTDSTDLDILFVIPDAQTGGGARDQLGLDERTVRVSVATSTTEVETLLESEPDCVLLDATAEGSTLIHVLERVRSTRPTTPVLVFTGDRGPDSITRVLDVSHTDVIQSTAAGAPPALIRQRVEQLVDAHPERSLATPADQYETILNTAADAIYQLDPTGTIVALNDAAAELLGYEKAELRGTNAREILAADSFDAGSECIARLLADDANQFETVDAELVRADGEVIPCEARIAVLTEDGEFVGSVGVLRDISDKRKREQELRERDELLRHLSENVSDVVWVNGPNGEIEFVSAAYEAVWGRPRAELDEDPQVFTQYIHPADRERVKTAHNTKYEDPDNFDETYRVVQPDGTVRWLRDRGFGVYEDGELQRVVGIAQDITEQKEREQELERLKERLELAIRGANLCVWDYQIAEGGVEYSGEVASVFDADAATIDHSVEEWEQRIHPDDHAAVMDALDALLAGESTLFEQEYRFRTDEGTWKWIRDIGQVVKRDDDGDPLRAVGVMFDITDRKNRETELARNREFLEQTQQVADIGGWEVDFDSRALRWTDEVYQIHDLQSTAEPTLDEWLSYFHDEDEPTVREAVELLQSGGRSFDLELRVHTDGETPRWVRLWGEPLTRDEDVVGARGVIRDIDDRKRREHELQAEREIVERILETSPVGIVVHDETGHIVNANEQAATVLGVGHDVLVGASVDPSNVGVLSMDGTPLDPEQLPFHRIKETGEPVRDQEITIEKPNGERAVLSVDGAPLFEDGELKYVITTFDDITDRVQREQHVKEQRNELAQLDRINQTIRNVDQALVGATTRSEIEQTVCANLSESGRYSYTVALRPIGDDGFDATASSGMGGELAAKLFPKTGGSSETSPAKRALETEETVAIQDLDDPATFPQSSWQEHLLDQGIHSLAAVPLHYDGHQYGAIVIYVQEMNAFSDRELAVLDELGKTVGHAIAAVESREREQSVTTLYEATQDLLAAETPQDVSEVVVDTAAEVLDPPGIGMFLFDDEENVLRAAATTEKLAEFYGEQLEFGPGRADSVTWETYVRGETREYRDIREADRIGYTDTDARTCFFQSLGEHGVFVVASTQERPFDEVQRRLIGLLATTTEAALDRVAGKAGIRERDQRLEERAATLERFEQMFSFIDRTNQLLRNAGTRNDIERGVCDQIASIQQCSFAWIGTVVPDGETIEPTAWAGEDDGYLDAVALTPTSEEPAARTLQSGEPTGIDDVTDLLRSGTWAQEAVDRGYQSVLAVPLVYGEATYGVLTVYATTPDFFDDVVEQTLTSIGKTIAHSINTVETKRGILSEQVVEVEFGIPEDETFFTAVADVADQPVTYREIKPESEEMTEVLFALEDVAAAEVLSLESDFVTVESVTHVESGEEDLFLVTISGPTIASTILECGGIPQEIRATASETRTVVRLPRALDVREFLDRLRQRYPAIELYSRRDVDGSDAHRAPTERAFEAELTDRQREVLVTAYEVGFFESPRETTGAELADLLDISQPTVTHHLREAQRRLFESLFEQ